MFQKELNSREKFLTQPRNINYTYVIPPSPMAVKKLIAKRVSRGLSLGKSPSKNGASTLQMEGESIAFLKNFN